MISTVAKYSKMIGPDEKGRATIAGTRYRVVFLANEHVSRGWSAAELRENHPDLSPAQIDAALAYFYDNRGEIESEMQEIKADWHDGRAASMQTTREELQARLKQ